MFGDRPRTVLMRMRQRLWRCPACGQRAGQGTTPYPGTGEAWQALELRVCGHCGFGYVHSRHLEPAAERRWAGRSAEATDPRTTFDELEVSTARSACRARHDAVFLEEQGACAGRLLDVSPGIGALLHFAPAGMKFAAVWRDEHRAHLDYLGVHRIGVAEIGVARFDTIVAKEILDRQSLETFAWFLRAAASSVRARGWLYVEVEDGRDLHESADGPRGLEPRTLFFSPASLSAFLGRAGFVVRHCASGGQIYVVDESGRVDATRLAGGSRTKTGLVVLAERTSDPAPRPKPRASLASELRPRRRRSGTVRRLAKKLVRDPASFFADSQTPAVRRLGALVWPSRAGRR